MESYRSVSLCAGRMSTMASRNSGLQSEKPDPEQLAQQWRSSTVRRSRQPNCKSHRRMRDLPKQKPLSFQGRCSGGSAAEGLRRPGPGAGPHYCQCGSHRSHAREGRQVCPGEFVRDFLQVPGPRQDTQAVEHVAMYLNS